MQIVKFPAKSEWASFLERPHRDASELRETVKTVLDDIQARGDVAVKEYELKFDKVQLDSLQLMERCPETGICQLWMKNAARRSDPP
jgi:histidinol dehydrogenase